MKLFFRNSKWIVIGLILFFMGYCIINNIDSKTTKQLNSDATDLENKLELEPEIKEEKVITPEIKEEKILVSSKEETKQENQETKIKRFIAYDGGGFGSVNSGITKCSDSIEVEVIGSSNRLAEADILYFHMGLPHNYVELGDSNKKRHYTMVYAMESEPHSYGGETWMQADFRMWYNLEKSFPEPATYFENKMHLISLLSPPKVSFDKKEQSSPIAWVVSNCNAYNGREKYMKKLMDKIGVDSYGGCLKNKFSHPAEHMTGNIQLFSKYKFVIAIENSNCMDYVTEKLVHAVASGAIPIVAGKDNKPDYLRFLPKKSYINIYDYKTIDELVNKINSIASNRTEYDSYMTFKFTHNYTREYLQKLSLNELIVLAKKIIDPKEEFFIQLIDKEKSENKLCKVARYLNKTPKDLIDKQIKENKMNRPDSSSICLPNRNLANDL